MNETYPWSDLTKVLIEVIEINLNEKLQIDDWYVIEQEVEDWSLNLSWVVDIFKSVKKREIKGGYLVEKDLPGFLAELEEDYLVNYEDYGEGIEWGFDNGVKLFISREAGENHSYTIYKK